MALEKIINFAMLNDCQHLEGYGRKAWGRALKSTGSILSILRIAWNKKWVKADNQHNQM